MTRPDDVYRCCVWADDERPGCIIGAVRCVLLADHEGDHIWDRTRRADGSAGAGRGHGGRREG